MELKLYERLRRELLGAGPALRVDERDPGTQRRLERYDPELPLDREVLERRFRDRPLLAFLGGSVAGGETGDELSDVQLIVKTLAELTEAERAPRAAYGARSRGQELSRPDLRANRLGNFHRGEGMKIAVPQERIADFCRRWKIAELALFGSALRDDFGPESDVDLLVSWEPDAQPSLFDLVEMEEGLTEIFGHKVDLVEKRSLHNQFIRHQILHNYTVLYAA